MLDDVTKECLAAVADTSISGRRVARELDAVIAKRGKPDLIVSDHETDCSLAKRHHLIFHGTCAQSPSHKFMLDYRSFGA